METPGVSQSNTEEFPIKVIERMLRMSNCSGCNPTSLARKLVITERGGLPPGNFRSLQNITTAAALPVIEAEIEPHFERLHIVGPNIFGKIYKQSKDTDSPINIIALTSGIEQWGSKENSGVLWGS
ncbi:hypothetical protein AVEN_215642-1 [Araneus ventricosus]|uniref:Uncharacterized protein n=1 Tax=Araneus ventricosus TaxID=182803 RepID=A0A4Y2KFQ4_ARAVE|nr:hypothetical protein AVEN_215642-1 [Araneus ventricosus]